MREVFPGYYTLPDSQIQQLWRDGFFAFDANVLLGLYRYSPKTRELMLRQIEGLASRVWLPHQAALEYQRGRLKVIRDQQRGYQEAEDAVENVVRGLKKELKRFEQRHPYIDPHQISAEFEKTAAKVKASLKKMRARHPDLTRRDTIRSKLDRLFKGKVGPEPTPEIQEALFSDAQRRLDLKIPPGYADVGKEGARKLGDAIIWLQLLEQAKASGEPFIFITDDEKPDWWDLDSSPSVPRPELMQEMLEFAGARFWMYNTSDFIRRSQQFNRVSPEAEAEAAIEEVEEVQTRSRRLFFDPSTLAGLNRLADAQKNLFRQWAELGNLSKTFAWPALNVQLPQLPVIPRSSLLDLAIEQNLLRAMAESSVGEEEAHPEDEVSEPEKDAMSDTDDSGGHHAQE